MFSQLRVLYPLPARNSSGVIADQVITVTASAAAPTAYTDSAAGGSGVLLVTFDVQAGNVRARWDGTAPTASVGHLLYAGQGYIWPTAQYNACQFIRDTTAAAATIHASAMNA